MCGGGGSEEVVFQPDLNNRALAARRGARAGSEHSQQSDEYRQSPEVGRSVAHGRKRQPVWLEHEVGGAGVAMGVQGQGLWAQVSGLGLVPQAMDRVPGPGHPANSWTGRDGLRPH